MKRSLPLIMACIAMISLLPSSLTFAQVSNIRFAQLSRVAPDSVPFQARANMTFDVNIPLSDNPQFLNVMGLSLAMDEVWTVQNWVLLPHANLNTITLEINLTPLFIENGFPASQIPFRVLVSDTIWTQPGSFPISDYTPYPIAQQSVVIGPNVGEGSTPIPIDTIYRPIAINWFFDSLDYEFRGCDLPNIDLDASQHNPTTTPGYAGDENACGPVSAANSMEWLEDQHPEINTGTNERGTLEDLSGAMGRADNQGVLTRAFIEGKLAYIDDKMLPIHVKFQSNWVHTDVNSPNPAFGHSADNQNPDNSQRDSNQVNFDWIKAEMEAGEDVELKILWRNLDADTTVGSHYIALSGIGRWGPIRFIFFKHDLRQDRVDSTGRDDTVQEGSTWEETENGGPWENTPFLPFKGYRNRSGDSIACFVSGAISESYDSTVTFTSLLILSCISFKEWMME
jgi:hypothetical protein